MKFGRLGDKKHAFKTCKLIGALNCSMISTTFIFTVQITTCSD